MLTHAVPLKTAMEGQRLWFEQRRQRRQGLETQLPAFLDFLSLPFLSHNFVSWSSELLHLKNSSDFFHLSSISSLSYLSPWTSSVMCNLFHLALTLSPTCSRVSRLASSHLISSLVYSPDFSLALLSTLSVIHHAGPPTWSGWRCHPWCFLPPSFNEWTEGPQQVNEFHLATLTLRIEMGHLSGSEGGMRRV